MNTERATEAPDLDRRQVRRAFERAAATYDGAAVLQREVGQRMAERLGFVKMQPATILDAGCGTGVALGELRARYPDARLIGLDLALNMTLAARNRASAAMRSARSLLGRFLGPLAPAREVAALVHLRRHRVAADQAGKHRSGLEQSHAAVGRRSAKGIRRMPARAASRRLVVFHHLRTGHTQGVARGISCRRPRDTRRQVHRHARSGRHAGSRRLCRPGHGHGNADRSPMVTRSA